MLEIFKHKSSLAKVQRGMPAEQVNELLSDCRIVVEDCGHGLEVWEVWYEDGRLSYPAAEIYVDMGKVHSIDEHVCRPFWNESADLVEALFSALVSVSSSDPEKEAVLAKVSVSRASTTDVQQKKISIWMGDIGVTLESVTHSQNSRRVVLKKAR